MGSNNLGLGFIALVARWSIGAHWPLGTHWYQVYSCMSQRTVISGCPTAVNTSSKLGTTGRCRSGWRPSTPVPAGRPRAPLRGLRPFRLRARRPRGRRRASSRWGRVRRSRHSSLSHHRLGQPFQYYSVLLTKSRSICSILPSNSDDF